MALNGDTGLAVVCALAGLVIGYALAYWLTRNDWKGRVDRQVRGLRMVGTKLAEDNAGVVPWDAVERVLNTFPGQPRKKKDLSSTDRRDRGDSRADRRSRHRG